MFCFAFSDLIFHIVFAGCWLWICA